MKICNKINYRIDICSTDREVGARENEKSKVVVSETGGRKWRAVVQ